MIIKNKKEVKMNNFKKFSFILFLTLLIFLSGCGKKNVQDNFNAEIKLTPSKIPPSDQEIIKLENGYEITTRMALLIDQKCEADGLKGGDTGSGYGCVAK